MVRILEGDGQRRLREHDEARMRVHELARLIGFSVNDPQNIPAFEATTASNKGKAGEPVTSDADIIRAEGFFMALTMRAGTTNPTPVVLEEPA